MVHKIAQMQLDKSITIGNIVSWVLILVGLGMGYSRMESATAQNTRDVKEAREVAESVRTSLIASDAARNLQITNISINVAETRKDIYYMAEKVNEVLNETRKTKK